MKYFNDSLLGVGVYIIPVGCRKPEVVEDGGMYVTITGTLGFPHPLKSLLSSPEQGT